MKRLKPGPVDNLVVHGIFCVDRSANLALLHDVLAETGNGLVEVGDELQATVQVGEHGLVLADVNNGRSHEAEQVECHFLLRECANTKCLNTLSHNIVSRHKSSAASPANDGTADRKIVSPVLRVPTIEEGLQSKLGLGV